AQPGGLGTVPREDIRLEPTRPLRDVMALAQEHDLIALQYVNCFHEVLADGLPALALGLKRFGFLEDAIIYCQFVLLAPHPDRLIARKRGLPEAQEARRRAQAVLDAGWPTSPAGRAGFAKLDTWLREIGRASCR